MIHFAKISLIIAFFLGLSACRSSADSSATESFSQSRAEVASRMNEEASSTQSLETSSQKKSDVNSLPWDNYADAVSGLSDYRRVMTIHFEPYPANESSSSWQFYSIYTHSDLPERQIHQLSYHGEMLIDAIPSITTVQSNDDYFIHIPESGCMAIDEKEFGQMNSGIFNPEYYLNGILTVEGVKSNEMVNDLAASHFTLDKHSLPRFADQSVSLDGHLYVAENGGYPLLLTLTVSGEADFLDNGEVQQGTFYLEMSIGETSGSGHDISPINCLDTVPYPIPRNIFDLTVLGELVGFRTETSIPDLVSFFQMELGSLGWELVEEPTFFNGMAYMTFRLGQDELVIELEEGPANGAVSVLIAP